MVATVALVHVDERPIALGACLMVEERRCAFCGGEFEAVRDDQKFCRPSCRKGAEDERRKAAPSLFDQASGQNGGFFKTAGF